MSPGAPDSSAIIDASDASPREPPVWAWAFGAKFLNNCCSCCCCCFCCCSCWSWSCCSCCCAAPEGEGVSAPDACKPIDVPPTAPVISAGSSAMSPCGISVPVIKPSYDPSSAGRPNVSTCTGYDRHQTALGLFVVGKECSVSQHSLRPAFLEHSPEQSHRPSVRSSWQRC